MLIPDLILSIIDWLSDDTHTLCQCSLVNKQWLRFARHELFDNLTIKLCVRPINHDLCRRCIFHFSLLVASRHCTIPHSVRTLKLYGKDIEHPWFSLWSLVGNAGGMQNPQVVLAVMKHFRSIERLEMIGLEWFNPPWPSSRAVARALSSVKSLTLDGARFYGGPRGLIWMLDSMHNLEVLSMNDLSWPARNGMPNNPPALLVFTLNAACYYPRTCTPLYMMVAGVFAVTKFFRLPKSCYRLHKPLSRLGIDIQGHEINDPWCRWLLAQVQVLGSITTLVVSTRSEQPEALIFQGLSDIIGSLRRLTIYNETSFFHVDSATIIPLTLVKYRALEDLGIHICLDMEPQVLWLKNTLCTVQSSSLTDIRLTIETEMDKSFFICRNQSKAPGVAEIDGFLNSIPSLQRLYVFVKLSGVL